MTGGILNTYGPRCETLLVWFLRGIPFAASRASYLDAYFPAQGHLDGARKANTVISFERRRRHHGQR